jgi:branched-subunit amino acid aminotransferase/4-amino-4-deoxychorismate lyase
MNSPLLAADSWLVADGRVRALDRHWARFGATCTERGVDARALAAFRARVEAEVPGDGRWFPRVELRAAGELAFQVRPAPPREPAVVAWIVDVPDPRRAPRRKGPDLERLAALRERAAAHGAGEAVIADGDGRLLEGAFTSLLWWEGERLCVVADEAPILPGITRALLVDLARDREVRVEQRRPLPEDLAGRETWLVSALHGIRAVARWADGGPSAGATRRAEAWQRLLEGLATGQST